MISNSPSNSDRSKALQALNRQPSTGICLRT